MAKQNQWACELLSPKAENMLKEDSLDVYVNIKRRTYILVVCVFRARSRSRARLRFGDENMVDLERGVLY